MTFPQSHRCLLFLADALVLVVEELDLDVGVGGARDVHLLQLTRLQNGHCNQEKVYQPIEMLQYTL